MENTLSPKTARLLQHHSGTLINGKSEYLKERTSTGLSKTAQPSQKDTPSNLLLEHSLRSGLKDMLIVCGVLVAVIIFLMEIETILNVIAL